MNKRHAGLTLLEVIMAIAVLGILLAAFAYLHVSTLRLTGSSQRESRGMQEATRLIDQKTIELLGSAGAFHAHAQCSPACTETVSKGGVEGTITVKPAGGDYKTNGLLLVEVQLTSPAQTHLVHYVSCMDLNPVPTVMRPYPCPEAGQ